MSDMAKEIEPVGSGLDGSGNPLELIKQFTELLKEVNKLDGDKLKNLNTNARPQTKQVTQAVIKGEYEKSEIPTQQTPSLQRGCLTVPDSRILSLSFMSVLTEMKPQIEGNMLYRNATILQFMGQLESDEGFRKQFIDKIVLYYESYANAEKKTTLEKNEGDINDRGKEGIGKSGS